MSEDSKQWLIGVCGFLVLATLCIVSGPGATTMESCGKACGAAGVRVIDWRKCECNAPVRP